MSRPRLLAAATVAVLAGALAACSQHSSSFNTAGSASATIRMSDGTKISAVVVTPKRSGNQREPLIIMPASWSDDAGEYAFPALALASHGYEVVTYAQRGFAPSGGLVDWASTPTQQDATSVINWALKHTPSDPKQIGMLGISYGAGMSLLTAEHDPRIKAVVAMSTWTDLGAALDTNGTLDKNDLGTLLATTTGTINTELAFVKTALVTGQPKAAVQMLDAPQRSPITDISDLNKHGTAVMIANGFEDSIIPPNQLIDFYDRLTVPKRIQLEEGGHGGPEADGLKTTGAAMQGVWQDATNWLDHYVRGTDNGIQQQDPVRLRDVITNAWNGYPSWDAVGSATAQSLGLAQSFGTIGTGGAPWSRTLLTGVATVADAGPSEIGLSHFLPPTTPKLADIDPNDGLVFGGDALTSAREVSGVPQVHLTVHSSGSTATFFVYLYDVGKLGAARLMTFAPYTVTGANADKSVTVALRPIAWTMSKGDRLAIVIDTVDDRYLSSNAPGSTVTFSSSAADPATASIPFAG